MEEVKRREMQLYQLKKKIAENESKLKQQQTLYEAVCSDRNLCSKNLIEARDEITEMKRKLKIMSHQIDQLKEEIASKVRGWCVCVCVSVWGEGGDLRVRDMHQLKCIHAPFRNQLLSEATWTWYT